MDIKEKKPRYLLLPQEWEKINLPDDSRNLINILFCTYYPVVPKRNGNIIYDSLIGYIHSNYNFDRDIEAYVLYKKK
jgi:hypothetical protein